MQKNKAVYALPLLAKLLLLVCGAFLVWSSMGVSGSINASLGIYEIAKYALLFTFVLICVGIILQNAQLIASLCKAISIVMLLQAMAGIFQYHGVAFTELPGANALPYGLMANRNLFGSALAFMLPFSVYAVYNSKGFWRIFSISSLAVCAYALVLSQTRSAWLGAVAVMLVSLLLSVLFIKPFNKKWLLWYGIAAVSILAIGYIAVATDTQGGLAKEVTERVNSLAGGNAADSASGAAANSNERIKIWKKTLQVIKDNPVTGVGFGNWKVVVPKYGTSGTVWETGKTVPDRVHNVYLQVIAETGWLGGILFILIWLLVAGCGLVALKKSASNAQKFLIAVLLGGLAAFGIDCMFSFGIERIEHTVLLGLMAAILIAQYLQVTTKEKTETTTAKKMPWLLPVCYMGLAAFCIFLGKEKYHFEKQLPIANAYQKQGKIPKLLKRWKKEAAAGLP
ncbi:MAG: O-antigen ligase family protein [Chitinophagaceae bacterium]|nr:O-antigen ligase family protein [Chitinophagaceae bacterium]